MSNSINRIRFFTGAQPNVRVYGISSLAPDPSMPFAVNPQKVSFQDGTSHTTRNAIEKLAKIYGITRLEVEAFAIHITLAPVFNWSEKHDEVIKILKEVYFAPKDWNGEYDIPQSVEIVDEVGEGGESFLKRCVSALTPIDCAPDADR